MIDEPAILLAAAGAIGAIASAGAALWRESARSRPMTISTSGVNITQQTYRPFDLFLAYASDDSGRLARELAGALQAHNLTVWLDKEQVHLGDDLFEKINEGMDSCRYGLVILSPKFFKSEWSQRELDALIKRNREGSAVILPIWNGISEREVLRHVPSLASKFAISATGETVEELATAVAAIADPEATDDAKPRRPATD